MKAADRTLGSLCRHALAPLTGRGSSFGHSLRQILGGVELEVHSEHFYRRVAPHPRLRTMLGLGSERVGSDIAPAAF